VLFPLVAKRALAASSKVLVSWAARCFGPRSRRAVPWSVQAVLAREAEAAIGTPNLTRAP
jgi:hypothetical protein